MKHIQAILVKVAYDQKKSKRFIFLKKLGNSMSGLSKNLSFKTAITFLIK